VGQTAVDSAACGEVVVVGVVVVLVAAEDGVAVVELTDVDVVVVVGAVGLLLLPHAATTTANATSTEPARRCVTTVMKRRYAQPTTTGQGRSSLLLPALEKLRDRTLLSRSPDVGGDLRPYPPTRARADDAVRAKKEQRRAATVRATVGDCIVIRGHRVGEPDRACEVLEVRGVDGGSPYVVRWGDSGHETLFFPGSDATVQQFDHASKS
jgi:hypothetical protein